MHPDLKQLLKTLKREIYAPTEIPTVLIEFVATHQVDELAAQLPKGVEPQLRQVIAKLHAEDSVYIWEGILMAGVDPKDFFAEKKRLRDDGCRRWREHFGITGLLSQGFRSQSLASPLATIGRRSAAAKREK